MRLSAIAAAGAVTASTWFAGAGIAAASPEEAPSLADYKAVSVDPFLDTTANGGEVYFQTPDGLLCAIRPAQGRAGCDGALPGARAAVNEIVLTTDSAARGVRATPTPAFVKPTGGAARVLPAGSKITYADFECGVGEDSVTVCTKGSPVVAWMRIAPEGTGVGPRTAGLPSGVPDPVDYIGSDDSYIVGNGPRNIFPVFTVGDLTCRIGMFSGGEIACHGKLPGVTSGDDEVYVALPGGAGTRQAADPPFSSPSYPGDIRELPEGHRVDSHGGTCLATGDGVACMGAVDGTWHGFVVTADEVRTF
jgi:hypothetical protein